MKYRLNKQNESNSYNYSKISKLFKTSIKINKNRKNYFYKKNSYSKSLRPEKKYFLNKLNKLIEKSNTINQDFSTFINQSQNISFKLFNKTPNVNNKINHINIKEINKHFNFDKGFENNIEDLLKNNANKVKKVINPKCRKILDDVVKEMCLEEFRLNKNYFLNKNEEKLENNKAQVMDKYNRMFQNPGDEVFDIFKKKEEDLFNDIKVNENDENYIDQLYLKVKILNKFAKQK